MDNNAATVRAGSKVVIYATIVASAGTVTMTGPTFDLLDNNDAPLATAVAATGFDGVAASIRAWYDLDTTNAPGSMQVLTPGNYRLRWNIPVTTSGDGLARTEKPSTLIVLVP
jgi:hypothetical protein